MIFATKTKNFHAESRIKGENKTKRNLDSQDFRKIGIPKTARVTGKISPVLLPEITDV